MKDRILLLKNVALAAGISLFMAGSASAGLVVFDTDGTGITTPAVDDGSNGGTLGDGIADDGQAVLGYSSTQTLSGVTFTLSYDLTAIGGFLVDNGSDSIGVWSNSTADDVNDVDIDGQGYTVDNVVVSAISGGSAVFNGITRAGFLAAAASTDSGTFNVAGTSLTWTDLSGAGSDPFSDTALEGSGQGYRLLDSYVDAGQAGPITSFDLINNGTSSNRWRLSSLEFDVTAAAAVPEPSSLALVSIGVGLIGFRRRRLK